MLKKRQIKKNNRSRINMILSFIPFRLNGKPRFGSGYFIFEKPESSIAWFYLKDFPEWKFGIWLDEEGSGYSIFGQMIASIDKFKPYASALSSTDVQSFVNELYKIQDEHSDWVEYIESDREQVQEDNIRNSANLKIYSSIFTFIDEWNDDQSVNTNNNKIDTGCYLELIDGNRNGLCIMPRYSIHCLYSKKFLKEGTAQDIYLKSKESFLYLIRKMEEIYDPNIDKWMFDDYIFTDFGEEVLSKSDWVDDAIRYKRENTDHNKYLEGVFEYNREDYKIGSAHLKQLIVQKFLDNTYDDKADFKLVFSKEFEDYNIQYANLLINRLFRKPELANKWLNKKEI